MTPEGFVEAGVDHAVMAEQLLDEAARHEAEVERCRLGLDALLEQLGEKADESPDWETLQHELGRARARRDVALTAAQVHATLASAPRALGLVEFTSEVGTFERSSDVRQGDRVIMLNLGASRRFPVIANDTIGTVVSIGPEASPSAIVDWDDIHTEGEPIPVDQLRVVLGA